MKYVKLFEAFIKESDSVISMNDSESGESAPFDPESPWRTAIRDMKIGHFAAAVGGLGVLSDSDSLEQWAYIGHGSTGKGISKVGTYILNNIYGRAETKGGDRKELWIDSADRLDFYTTFSKDKGRSIYYMNQGNGGKHFIMIDDKICTFEFKSPSSSDLSKHLFDAVGTITLLQYKGFHEHGVSKPGELFDLVKSTKTALYRGDGTLGQLVAFAVTGSLEEAKKARSGAEVLAAFFQMEAEDKSVEYTVQGKGLSSNRGLSSIFVASSDKDASKYIGQINFEYKKSGLKADEITNKTLENLVKFINKEKPKKVTIVGHTDGKGSQAYNLPLSELRASAVKRHLDSKKSELPKGLEIEVIGKGKSEPIEDDHGGSIKSLAAINRRVEILFDGVRKTNYLEILGQVKQ